MENSWLMTFSQLGKQVTFFEIYNSHSAVMSPTLIKNYCAQKIIGAVENWPTGIDWGIRNAAKCVYIGTFQLKTTVCSQLNRFIKRNKLSTTHACVIYWTCSLLVEYICIRECQNHYGVPAMTHKGPPMSEVPVPWWLALRPRQNGRHFADDTFKRIFLNENVRISIKISLKFVPKGPINNIPALVQIMAWRRPGDKPLSESMMDNLPTHICVTRPQWVNKIYQNR